MAKRDYYFKVAPGRWALRYYDAARDIFVEGNYCRTREEARQRLREAKAEREREE